MRSNSASVLDIGEARHRLEVWRRARRRGERIPEPLWAEAARVARAHGVSLVSRTLGLDYFGLKRRAKAVEPAGRSRCIPPPGFVEVPIVGPLGQVPSCTVELDRGAGARMTIRWEGTEGLDLVGLAEVFWRHRP
jgi:hypothetical protein